MNQKEHKPATDTNYNILEKSEVLIGEHTIDNAIQKIAEQLNQCYQQSQFKGEVISTFCIMNGGLYFSGQLLRYLNFPVKLSFLHASRYGDNTHGQKLTWTVKPKASDIEQQHILLLDDIFDEGLTLEAIAKECQQLGAKSVCSTVLVNKQHDRKPKSGFKPTFSGLEVEDRYIFGCGMDYKGLWRNLPSIYALKA
ncbi:hypoxanthine-guanine phosphoribosyltransferase [Kangiella sediminilitoris]|uniref:Phosphoribosyltransferase n=1 Tax=Kangiella sediminilitoris TaxID=1144748 RepID=A0A1B3BBF7_9GAMM|nr:hypoxanthine-guanine phosphoribosyltransferase [Kangiella sediminilitoris]AOE50119.1 phosphoribosyltransferase [Kangiella sediminilitoris]